jgi:hypothetical protein
MIKLYKNKPPNIEKMTLLFICQIILAVLPPALFAVYVAYVRRLQEWDEYNVWLGIIFISVMMLSFAGYSTAARKYNVLVSGYKGERLLVKTAKRLSGDYTVFTNLPIRYKKNRSEIDLLIIGENGVLIIEVKNHSGVITGTDNSETWIHRKYYRKGKTIETEMENPFKQIKRQREILKSILRSNGLNIWIDSILFFSGNPGLRLRVNNDIGIAATENELIGLIGAYKAKKPPSCEELAEIIRILNASVV